MTPLEAQTQDRQEILKAKLMAELEGEIDALLKVREGGKPLTLTQIEDSVLAARQRLGQRLTEELVQAQEAEQRVAAPVNPVTQQRMESKGKKTRRSKRG